MAGIRIGGSAILPPLLPDIPILVFDAGINERSLWQIGNAATPIRMGQTAVTSLGTPQIQLADPQREPTYGEEVVYCQYNSTGTLNRSILLADWDDVASPTLIYTETGTVGISLEPMWKPDGTKIVFRSLGAGSDMNLIKTMDPDGSNVTTIYTGATTVYAPTYSHGFGDYIVFTEGQDVHVMEDDGTNEATVYTGTSIYVGSCWSWGNDLIAVRDTIGGNEDWITMAPDGTGQATWLSTSRAGYGPGQSNPGPIIYTWTNNDELATTIRVTADPDPDARLTLIDSGGNNFISPALYAANDTGSFDVRPAGITGFDEGVERIYLFEVGPSDFVSSVLPDGSDYRVDFDEAPAVFHGFRGDTQN
jgi:hypothetical protein